MQQKEVANFMGVRGSTISNWENGRSQPDIDEFIKLCSIYGVNYTDFLTKAYGDITFQENIYAPEEVAHLQKYRALDDNGRAAVDSVLNTLYGQQSDKIADSSDETTAS
jgi:DNA-binding helix-turn-helix protein